MMNRFSLLPVRNKKAFYTLPHELRILNQHLTLDVLIMINLLVCIVHLSINTEAVL